MNSQAKLQPEFCPFPALELEQMTNSDSIHCLVAELVSDLVVVSQCNLKKFTIIPKQDNFFNFVAVVEIGEDFKTFTGCWQTSSVRFFRTSSSVKIMLETMVAEKYLDFIKKYEITQSEIAVKVPLYPNKEGES